MFISKVNFETESVEEIEKLRQCLDRPLILSQKIEKKIVPEREDYGVFAKEDLEKGHMIFNMCGKLEKLETEMTIQLTSEYHLQTMNETDIDNFLNHLCNYNCAICYDDMTMRTVRDVKMGEELGHNYLANEYDDNTPFECKCGTENCIGEQRGFKYLTFAKQEELEPILAPYLLKLLQKARKELKQQIN